MTIFYEWYCIEITPSQRERRRKLRWRMTHDEALAWATKNPGKRLEMVPGSVEERGEGDYLGREAVPSDPGKIEL